MFAWAWARSYLFTGKGHLIIGYTTKLLRGWVKPFKALSHAWCNVNGPLVLLHLLLFWFLKNCDCVIIWTHYASSLNCLLLFSKISWTRWSTSTVYFHQLYMPLPKHSCHGYYTFIIIYLECTHWESPNINHGPDWFGTLAFLCKFKQ